jgi:hypothetical protein
MNHHSSADIALLICMSGLERLSAPIGEKASALDATNRLCTATGIMTDICI